MGAATRNRSTFADLLKADLDDAGISVSELARRLCDTDGDMPASKRRMLQHYLSGKVTPGKDARNEIAYALGINAERYATDLEREQQLRKLMAAFRPIADILLDSARDAAAAAIEKAER